MNNYQLAEIVGNLSIVFGIIMIVFAFLLPKGWTSALGLLILSCGCGVVAASFIHAPEGPTYARMAAGWVFKTPY